MILVKQMVSKKYRSNQEHQKLDLHNYWNGIDMPVFLWGLIWNLRYSQSWFYVNLRKKFPFVTGKQQT